MSPAAKIRIATDPPCPKFPGETTVMTETARPGGVAAGIKVERIVLVALLKHGCKRKSWLHLPLTSCVTSGKSLNLSEFWYLIYKLKKITVSIAFKCREVEGRTGGRVRSRDANFFIFYRATK